jgi:hypothetical protein
MIDLISKRERYGNGHKAWLANLSPPWDLVKEVGQAWDEVRKNLSSTVLIDTVRKWREFEAKTNKEYCVEMKEYFEREHIDPLDLPTSGPWSWLADSVFAIQVATSFVNGRAPPRGRNARMIQEAGRINANVQYANFNAWLHGSQTFCFSLPLAAKLMLTDVSHVRWKDFHMPFPAFVIQLPPELATLVDLKTGEHKIDSIIMADGTSQGYRRIALLFTGMENENSKDLGDDAVLFANLWCEHEDDLIESSIKSNRGNYNEDGTPAQGDLALFAGAKGDEATKLLMRWACAMVLYLTSHPQDLVKETNSEVSRLRSKIPTLKGKAKRNAKRKVRALLNETSPFLVGTKVTIDPRLEKIAGAIGRGKALPPSVASYVRGHMKMQPHGPGSTLRRPQWIEPYWRNLEQERSTSKKYDVR